MGTSFDLADSDGDQIEEYEYQCADCSPVNNKVSKDGDAAKAENGSKALRKRKRQCMKCARMNKYSYQYNFYL